VNDTIVIKNIVLRSAFEIAPEQIPTTSLCLVGPPLPRPPFLEQIGPHVDELVVVLVDCNESLRIAFEHWLDGQPALAPKPRVIVSVDPSSHPHLYRKDVPETFTQGSPLADEIYPGPFSGNHFVADWSAVRNLGFNRCSMEWRLNLEVNEMLDDPEQITSACFLLNEHRRDLGYLSVRRPVLRRSFLAGKLARNLPALRWEGTARESLEGALRASLLDNFLQTSLKSHGRPHPTEAEIFQILYAEARAADWAVPPVNLLHMAKTARYVGMPDFAKTAIDSHLNNSLYPEERAWACAIQGELMEEHKEFSDASRWYERSLEEQPGWKSAYRLSRSRFKESKWQACVDAYRAGLANQDVIQLVDDGCESRETALIYVAVALQQLGQGDEAREVSAALRLLFPANQTILELCETIG
jgi:hypothetical protein